MTKIPSYIRIKNMPGKWKTIKIEGDTVHVVDEHTGSRTVHRSRAIFLPETPKPKPPKPPEPPKWEQGELFGKSAFGIVHKYLEETKEGWIVRSKTGKPLSKPATREQALKRLRQIEYYKHAKQPVSKIAMRPIYHGTSTESAKALLSGKPFTSGVRRNGAWAQNGRETIFGTPQSTKDYAQAYAYKLSRTKKGKPKTTKKGRYKYDKGTVLVYNGVGVKTTHPNIKPTDLEQNFFADELGKPVGAIKIKESLKHFSRRTANQNWRASNQ